MSRKRKERLKSVLCEDARGLCDKDTTNLEFLFSEKLVESLREAKETFKVSRSMVKDNSSTPSFNKMLDSRTGYKCSSDNSDYNRGSSLSSLNIQGQAKTTKDGQATNTPRRCFTNIRRL